MTIKVLFVCMGNICRSPTVHGVFRHLVQNEGLSAQIEIDSAGTLGFHSGDAPDRRAQMIARQRGIDISDLRARQVTVDDFEYFDYVIAMDYDNLSGLKALCSPEYEKKLHLMMAFAPQRTEKEVPDPYYSGGFEPVFDMVEEASTGLLADIRKRWA